MQAIDPKITQAQLKELLHYDPETGEFTWLTTVSMRVGKGMPAGGVNAVSGYRVIRLGGLRPTAQRIACLYMTGEWPTEHMDHINGVRHDNRWCNLRMASTAGNAHNARVRPDNTSGAKGVYWREDIGRWCSQVRHLRKNHVKTHESYEQAVEFAEKLRTQLHGEFARHQ